MSALEVRRRERALCVGGRVDGAGGDVELGGLHGVGEVVALEELVASDLPVVGVVGGTARGVFVVGSIVVVLGYHGRRVGAAFEIGRPEACGTGSGRASSRQRLDLVGASRLACTGGAGVVVWRSWFGGRVSVSSSTRRPRRRRHGDLFGSRLSRHRSAGSGGGGWQGGLYDGVAAAGSV